MERGEFDAVVLAFEAMQTKNIALGPMETNHRKRAKDAYGWGRCIAFAPTSLIRRISFRNSLDEAKTRSGEQDLEGLQIWIQDGPALHHPELATKARQADQDFAVLESDGGL